MSVDNGRQGTQYRLREDGYIFSDEYLTEGNEDVAKEYLWPIPVFQRHREDTEAKIGYSDETIKPGDILEYCGGHYEEYLLVVAILPVPAQYSQYLEIKDSDRILCYSSNSESYRLFTGGGFINKPGNRVDHPSGEYVIHRCASNLVESSTDCPADVTYPPRPIIGKPSERTKKKYPHQHPPNTDISPSMAIQGDTKPLKEFTNEIECGNALEVLRTIPSDSVHGFVTSPPYYKARDYHVSDQLGQEESVNEYLESLLNVVNQLMRVTRDDGVGGLVVDDVYRDGALLGIPHKLHQEIVKQDYSVIHHSPWTKPNAKPEAVNNRYTHTHEHILIIAHEGGKHYFNKQEAKSPEDVFNVKVGNSGANHDAVFPVELPMELIRTTIPKKVCPECGVPLKEKYEVTDIRDLPTGRKQAKRALELAKKHDLKDEQLRAIRSVGLGGIGQAKRTQSGSGNNRDDIEQLAAEAREALGSYAREFTSPRKQKTGYEIKCDCDIDESDAEPGIVLDPFLGSGTTAIAAKRLRRRWIGIELNEEYITEAQSRIGVDVENPEQLTDSGQNTLSEFVAD